MAPRPPHKMLYRMAARIQEHVKQGSGPLLPLLPEREWADLLRTVRRFATADERGWVAAQRSLTRDFVLDAGTVIRRLEGCRQAIESAGSPERIASISDLYDDLIDLQKEFGNLEINLRENRVSVATDEIVLEGVGLGRFEIVLSVNDLANNPPYEIIALDENPAGNNSDVVHPHVHGGMLCEGEGRAPIGAALREGRLFDFFILVRQVLQTYNAGNAYVSLAHWGGLECYDCGSRVSAEEATSCGGCDNDLCQTCCDTCRTCERQICSDCRSPCQSCDESVCLRCERACEGCSALLCPACLPDGLCTACSQPKEPHDETPSAETESAREEIGLAALHPLCLGQAPVPA